ncbi:hypothetical protein BX666DRAFT_1909821 [Dichotomocladium elegans]|nr:hypothetical protein BX666DRAFT_1909821 [Dichotomocladium elegans]
MQKETPMVIFNEHDRGHREVRDLLSRINILQYLDTFLSEGFDCLKSICEVSEDDLIALKVKRGHRRLIQREIATIKGIPRNQPLWIRMTGTVSAAHSSSTAATPMNTSSISDASSASGSIRITAAGSQMGDSSSSAHGTSTTLSGKNTSTTLGQSSTNSKGSDSSMDDTSTFSCLPPPPKRRYRRHPRPDRNAPVKPTSAYVMFSNDIRAQLKGQNLTFAQLARATGERWKALDDTERQRYEAMALEAKKMYTIALEKYRLSPEYKVRFHLHSRCSSFFFFFFSHPLFKLSIPLLRFAVSNMVYISIIALSRLP